MTEIRPKGDEKESNMRAYKMVIIMGFVFALSFLGAPAMSADSIDAEADKILHSMTNYLGRLPSLSVRVDVDNEFVGLSGQKLQLSSSGEIAISRPAKLNVNRQGPFAETRLAFDGKVISLHAKGPNIYFQIDSPGTIDDAIATIQERVGLDAPAADLFYSDSYPGLISDVVSSAYHGTAYVNGIECHHLAFRKDRVDSQLWIQVGDTPLPMKYVITTKWLTGAPQYAVRFRDWNVNPQTENKQFDFSVPEGAKKIDRITVNEMGEFTVEGSQ
jgi:hypothetical protein